MVNPQAIYIPKIPYTQWISLAYYFTNAENSLKKQQSQKQELCKSDQNSIRQLSEEKLVMIYSINKWVKDKAQTAVSTNSCWGETGL